MYKLYINELQKKFYKNSKNDQKLIKNITLSEILFKSRTNPKTLRKKKQSL